MQNTDFIFIRGLSALGVAVCATFAYACGTRATPSEGREPGGQTTVNLEERARPSVEPAVSPREPEEVLPARVSWLERVHAIPGSQSTSVGGPNDGHLVGGVGLPTDALGLMSNDRRPNALAYFGTVEMIQLLVESAERIATSQPGALLWVNDIGFEAGGEIPHHASHEAGRDVDVLFYLVDADGAPVRSRPIPIEPNLTGCHYADLQDPDDDECFRFDVPTNWRLIEAMLQVETDSPIQRIFLVEHLRSELLSYASAHGASPEVVRRFGELTCQPSVPHDDHFHVRLFCSIEDRRAGCQDSAPMYPWQRASIESAGLEASTVAPPRSPRGSHAEATSPPAMHSSVREFLTRRAAWERQPHPGRPFCR